MLNKILTVVVAATLSLSIAAQDLQPIPQEGGDFVIKLEGAPGSYELVIEGGPSGAPVALLFTTRKNTVTLPMMSADNNELRILEGDVLGLAYLAFSDAGTLRLPFPTLQLAQGDAIWVQAISGMPGCANANLCVMTSNVLGIGAKKADRPASDKVADQTVLPVAQ